MYVVQDGRRNLSMFIAYASCYDFLTVHQIHKAVKMFFIDNFRIVLIVQRIASQEIT